MLGLGALDLNGAFPLPFPMRLPDGGIANVTADNTGLPLLPSSKKIITVDSGALDIATYASAIAASLLVTRGERI